MRSFLLDGCFQTSVFEFGTFQQPEAAEEKKDPKTSSGTLLKTNSSHLKIYRAPKGNDRLPIIQPAASFQGR